MAFEECFSVENLLKAHKLCRRSKTHKKEVVGFELNLGENLTKLSNQIMNGYKVSKYKNFKIYEPKERVILALPYRDRVVQMALCRGILEPLLESRLIYDNAACRKGKGTHFALGRLRSFLHKLYSNYGARGYFLKIDIKKYFASIDHDILKKKLKKLTLEAKTLDLLFRFIDSTVSDKKGLPLGNQTSQWFALFYLDEIDRLIKEKLQIKYYVRYMDDLILVCQDKQKLKYCLDKIKEVCQSRLKLELNSKTQLGKAKDGIDFLGFRTFFISSGKIITKLRQSAKIRTKKKLKLYKKLKANNLVGNEYIYTRLCSISGHLKGTASFLFFNKQASKNGLI